MTKEFKLNMIQMPNFLTIAMPPRPRQEGFNPSPTIAVEDLTHEEALQYAESMKAAFLDHWRNRQPQLPSLH